MTWAFSENFSNNFNRAIQEERSRESQVYTQSNQDNTSIPGGPPAGRRLSYQRAVSGEDPMPFRYHDSTLKKKHLIPEKSEVSRALIFYDLLLKNVQFHRVVVSVIEYVITKLIVIC